MAFQDYSAVPAENTTIGDAIFIGPNMERAKVRPSLQQLAADGKLLTTQLLPDDRNGKFLAWDASGNAMATSGTGADSALRVDLAAASGAALAGWRRATGTSTRSVDDVLRENAVSVFDFMTPTEIASVVYPTGTGTLDVSDAINDCFAHATTYYKAVYLPGGTYGIGSPLLFGSQNTGGQSNTPLALFGDGRNTACLSALAGLTGTLLQSWSCVGVTFENFFINTTGTAAKAWDCDWKAGSGPSTQNWIRNIRVDGGTATTHVSLKDLNDTFPDCLQVAGTDPSQCGIDMTQSGGLSCIYNSITTNCFLRFGTQNGSIINHWGMGVELAAGCLNYVTIQGCQFYENTSNHCQIWSQSFASFQSAGSLIINNTQFISSGALTSHLNVNAYSTIELNGCQFNGATANLLGASSRSDSFATVFVKINGGSTSGPVTLNTPTGFAVQAEGFINALTGFHITKIWEGTFTPTVIGTTSAGTCTYSVQTGKWWRFGNLVKFNISIAWTVHTGTGELRILGIPYSNVGPAEGAVIAVNGNTFVGVVPSCVMGSNYFGFNEASTGAVLPGTGATAIPATGLLAISGTFIVNS